MKTIGVLYRDGKIKPLPFTTFPISRIAEAYTEFSRFTHTGKLLALEATLAAGWYSKESRITSS